MNPGLPDHWQTLIYIYIYIYILDKLNNSPYGKKKPGKWFEDENIQRITVKGKKIYIGKKKEKANLIIPIEKKIKRHTIGWSKEKTLLGLLSYNAKSVQY